MLGLLLGEVRAGRVLPGPDGRGDGLGGVHRRRARRPAGLAPGAGGGPGQQDRAEHQAEGGRLTGRTGRDGHGTGV